MTEDYIVGIKFSRLTRRVRFDIGTQLNYNVPTNGKHEIGWNQETLSLVKENGQMEKLKRIMRDKGILDD